MTKLVPYTLETAPVLPCQKIIRHELMVETTLEHDTEILTPEAMRLIETLSMQDRIKLLEEAVKILHEGFNKRD